MKRKTENLNLYTNIHHWIIDKYGKAIKCEFCSGEKAKRFEWALKKGYEYERNIDNYMQLCPSCHRKYDYTEEQRRSAGERLSAMIKDGRREKLRVWKGVTGKNNHLSKAVIQLDKKTGEYIQEYDSITLAASSNEKFDITGLIQCLKKRRPSAYGYKWIYKVKQE